MCSRVNGKREKSGITILASCKSTLRNFLMCMHSIENEVMQITNLAQALDFCPLKPQLLPLTGFFELMPSLCHLMSCSEWAVKG